MNKMTLSQKIGTSFPYDWPNPSGMKEEVFVRQVISRGLFKDMLKTIRYLGFDSVEPIFNEIEANLPNVTKRTYYNIKIGYQNAQNQNASRKHTKSF